MYNAQPDPAYRSGWDHSYVPPPRVTQPEPTIPEESNSGESAQAAPETEAVDQTVIPYDVTPKTVSSEE